MEAISSMRRAMRSKLASTKPKPAPIRQMKLNRKVRPWPRLLCIRSRYSSGLVSACTLRSSRLAAAATSVRPTARSDDSPRQPGPSSTRMAGHSSSAKTSEIALVRSASGQVSIQAVSVQATNGALHHIQRGNERPSTWRWMASL